MQVLGGSFDRGAVTVGKAAKIEGAGTLEAWENARTGSVLMLGISVGCKKTRENPGTGGSLPEARI